MSLTLLPLSLRLCVRVCVRACFRCVLSLNIRAGKRRRREHQSHQRDIERRHATHACATRVLSSLVRRQAIAAASSDSRALESYGDLHVRGARGSQPLATRASCIQTTDFNGRPIAGLQSSQAGNYLPLPQGGVHPPKTFLTPPNTVPHWRC